MAQSPGDPEKDSKRPKIGPKVTRLPRQLACRHSQLKCAGCGKRVTVSAEVVITVED